VALGIDSLHVDDDLISPSVGDGDGQFNPGETIQLRVQVKNTGSSQTATNVAGLISSTDPYLTITQASASGPDAAPGTTSLLTSDFILHLSNEAPDGRIVQIPLAASCSEGSWNNLISLPVVAPLAECLSYQVMDSSGVLNPGQQENVVFRLLNSGGDPLVNATGQLTSLDPHVNVLDANGSWSLIAPDSTALNTADPFRLVAAYYCPPGWVANLRLIVTAGNYCDTMFVPFRVGQVNATDPAGPDQYGYRCFDSRDRNYTQTPVYAWVEASTQPGQETLNLPDPGDGQDKVLTHNLPFIFRHYGQNYTQISICSNGWLSMGSSTTPYFRNMSLPAALSPSAMIAPFWDDLYTGSGSVNYWYDSANHRLVVEWKNNITATGGGVNRFEAILYDPAFYPTSSGDGEIVFQYDAFANVDYNENYCTVGIENQTREDGLKVTYANIYGSGSAVITAGVALKFTTNVTYTPGSPQVTLNMTPANPPIQIPANGGNFNFNVQFNNGNTGPVTSTFWFKMRLPDGLYFGPVLGPITVTLPAGFNGNRNRIQTVPATFPPGNYLYYGYVGTFPDSIWDQASFPFTKLTTVGNSPPQYELANTGDPFEDWLSLQPVAPAAYRLESATPNPFNPTTTIGFELQTASRVELTVWDLNGRLVTTLVNDWREAGTYRATFDGSKLSSGLYFVRLQAGDFHAVQKLALVK
jgi:hypothetical protein